MCTRRNTGTGGTVLVIGLPTPIPEKSTFTVVVEAGPSFGAIRRRELAFPLVERDIGGATASSRPG